MKELIQEVKACNICSDHLPLGPRPIISVDSGSKIIIIGQAPGLAVHNSGIPWDDKSGDNLRNWMNVSNEVFYDPKRIALIPMGFCYPGKGKSGDLPPRKECAPEWHKKIIDKIDNPSLVVLIGQYAQNYYLKHGMKATLTETVKNFESYLPNFFVLPHPSPRNNIWQKKNPWFKSEVLPALKQSIQQALTST